MSGVSYAASSFLKGVLPGFLFTEEVRGLPKNLLEERVRERFSIKSGSLEHELKQRIWDELGRASRFYESAELKIMFGFNVLWNAFVLMRSYAAGKSIPYHMMYRVSFLPDFSPDTLGKSSDEPSFWENFKRMLSSYFASCGGILPDVLKELDGEKLKTAGSLSYEVALEKSWYSLAKNVKTSQTFRSYVRLRYSFFVRRLALQKDRARSSSLNESEIFALLGVNQQDFLGSKDYLPVFEASLDELPELEIRLSRKLFRNAFHEFHFRFDESVFFSFYVIASSIVRDIVYLLLSPSPMDSKLVAVNQIRGG